MGLEGLAELAKFVTAGRHADHGRFHRGVSCRLRPHQTASRVEHPAALFARGSILRGRFTDPKSPDRLWLRSKRYTRLLQSGPGVAWRARRLRRTEEAARGGWPLGQNVTPNAVPVQHLPLRSNRLRTPAAPPSREKAPTCASMRALSAFIQRDLRSARGDAIPAKIRTTCCCPAPSRADRRFRTGRSCSTCQRRQRPHCDVRAAPVLALADAGNLFPRLQRDSELESSGRREACSKSRRSGAHTAGFRALEIGSAHSSRASLGAIARSRCADGLRSRRFMAICAEIG